MALVSPTDLVNGQRIQFKTLNDSDNNTYIGTITGLVGYPLARTYMDLLPYSQAVLKSNPQIPPLEELIFLVLAVLENSTQPSTFLVFALDWIDTPTLSIIEDTSSFDIRVYGAPATEADTIVQLLRSAGYTVQQLVSTSS